MSSQKRVSFNSAMETTTGRTRNQTFRGKFESAHDLLDILRPGSLNPQVDDQNALLKFVASLTSSSQTPSRKQFDDQMGPILRKYNIVQSDIPWDELVLFTEKQNTSQSRHGGFHQVLPRLMKDAIATNDLGRLVERFQAVLKDEPGLPEEKRQEVISSLRLWLSQPSETQKRNLLNSIASLQVFVNKQVFETVAESVEPNWLERKSAESSAIKRKRMLLKERLSKSIERRSNRVHVAQYLGSRSSAKDRTKVNLCHHQHHCTEPSIVPVQISTDYDERFEYSRPGSSIPKAHSHSNCYHDQEPWRGRSGYYAKTQHYTPLSREEYRMLKHGDIMHCHYREEFDHQRIKTYFMKTVHDLKLEKEKKLSEEALKVERKKSCEERNKSIRLENKKRKMKKFEPALHNRFLTGIAEPKIEHKTKSAPDDKKKSSSPKPNYLKPKKALPEDAIIDKDQPISVYFLKVHEEKAKLEAKKKEEEQEKIKQKTEEEKKARRDRIALAAQAAKSKDPSSYGSAKLRIEEMKKKGEIRRQRLNRKRKMQELNKKARELAKMSRKKPLELDPSYVFDTTLDPPKQDVAPSVKEEMNLKVAENREKKQRAASADYKKIVRNDQMERRAKTREPKKVHFSDMQVSDVNTNLYRSEMVEKLEPAPPLPHSVEVRQRSKLLDAERDMLQEIHESIEKTELKFGEIQKGEKVISRKAFNDHLIMDPKDAFENQFFGLRPNPNFAQVHQKKLKGPQIKPLKKSTTELGISKAKSKLAKEYPSTLPRGSE